MNRVPHIEAVTVCVGYDDFLTECVKWNQALFEEWIIVTAPSDEKTREVCRRFNLRCVLTDDATRHANEKDGIRGFNKGRLIERGLQHTSATGHRLHLDADMLLPGNFRHRLEAAEVQNDTIYGIDRMMVRSYAEYQRLVASGFLQGANFDYHCRTQLQMLGFPMGTRWSHPQMGYVPIGFFQLWHSSQDEWRGVRIRAYPSKHSTACRTDVQHGLQWDRHKRALIPEVIGVHLESETVPKGANWGGRTTARFVPDHGNTFVPGKDGKFHPHHHHHHHHKPHPYSDGGDKESK